MRHHLVLSLALSSLAACGGGGSSSANAGGNPGGGVGWVYVAVDTAAGSDAVVQFQVAAATLGRDDGSVTGNLLASPAMVTFASPTGELDGLALQHVPTGAYANLHLVLVPGSGFARYADGSTASVQSAGELVVPVGEGLQHDASRHSYLEIGHNGTPPPAGGAGTVTWVPDLAGRSDGSLASLDSLRFVQVEGQGVTATWGRADDSPLHVSFGAGCEYFDDSSPTAGGSAFAQSLSGSDDLAVEGELHRDGTFVAHRAHRRHGGDDPRLIGRIVELRPATASFVFDVQAEVRRHGLAPQVGATQVLVLTQQAVLQTHGDHLPLQFGDLQVGQLAKVTWTTQTPVAGSLTEVTAREVEVGSGAGAPMSPEWEGSVQAVDTVAGTITVAPRGNDPIVIDGVSVSSATVHVDANTAIVRRAQHGSGQSSIGLGDILAGQDRIWWRGTVTGPDSVAATWVRVRVDG